MRTKLNRFVRAMVGAGLSVGALEASAQSLGGGDTAWVATSTVLVLFMTIPGLALFYAGMVRANAVVTLLLQCFAMACLVTVLWVIAGYSLAYGESLGIVGSLGKMFYAGVGEGALWNTIPESLFATFQVTFAIITPALVVGALVERLRFSAVLLFAALWSLLVYAPVAHWVWGGGWLGDLGVLDYAGGLVVHATAGTAALVVAIAMGPRPGFPGRLPPPHSMPFTVVGAGMLWVGWLGFNGGSAIGANADAAMAITVTHIAAAAGGLSWLLVEWLWHGKPKALGAVTGAIGGLASVTPTAGFVGPAAALVIGAAGGALCLCAQHALRRVLKLDDALDVVAVHLVGGTLGTLLAGVFASRALGLFGGEADIAILGQVRVQVIGVVATVLYTFVVTRAILALVNVVVRERVSEQTLAEGLDKTFHAERGYVFLSQKPPPAAERSPEPDRTPAAGRLPEPGLSPAAGRLPEPGLSPAAGRLPEPGLSPAAGRTPELGLSPSVGRTPEPGLSPSVGRTPEPDFSLPAGRTPSAGRMPEPEI